VLFLRKNEIGENAKCSEIMKWARKILVPDN